MNISAYQIIQFKNIEIKAIQCFIKNKNHNKQAHLKIIVQLHS